MAQTGYHMTESSRGMDQPHWKPLVEPVRVMYMALWEDVDRTIEGFEMACNVQEDLEYMLEQDDVLLCIWVEGYNEIHTCPGWKNLAYQLDGPRFRSDSDLIYFHN